MIRINFKHIFEPVEIGVDLMDLKFYSVLKNGERVLLKVEIRSLEDPLLPNVFNLFIDTTCSISFTDYSPKIHNFVPMRDSVQQQIDKFTALAATSAKAKAKTNATAATSEAKQEGASRRPTTNNLSLSIRDKAEADEFLTALNAVVQAARKK